MSNRFSRAIKTIKKLPKVTHSFLFTQLFCSQVKYARTSRITIVDIEPQQVKLLIKNHRKVQNHIGGVHAIAVALLAESATGIVFGMNLPDTALPLLKSMTMHFQRRMQGDLTAVASISEQQISQLTEEKGSMEIVVTITDESAEQPVQCIMNWAWVTKKSK